MSKKNTGKSGKKVAPKKSVKPTKRKRDGFKAQTGGSTDRPQIPPKKK